MKTKFYDSNGHEIVGTFDRSKGHPFIKPRYFGEFHHTDGTIACDGEFTQQRKNMTISEIIEQLEAVQK